MFTIRDNGAIVHETDGVATPVGSIEADTITLDLGWLKAAGAHVTIKQDPAVENKRGGVVLSR